MSCFGQIAQACGCEKDQRGPTLLLQAYGGQHQSDQEDFYEDKDKDNYQGIGEWL
jgi:hypothetical protein